jgi:hypothetical protein
VDDGRYDNVFDAGDPDICTDGSVTGHMIPHDGTYKGISYVCEHIMELQTMKLFLNDVSKNVLADKSSSGLSQIHCDFVKSLNTAMLSNPPTTPGSETNINIPMVRIMQLHGSAENWKHFVFLEKAINQYKASVS